MKTRAVHEPGARLMNADEVAQDAVRLAAVLRHNLLKSEHGDRLEIQFSALLAAVENLSRAELLALSRRIAERLSD
jgi:hypothetical protein